MWGSNVLRLRRCLSAARNAPRQFRRYSAAREPVSDSEFLKALEEVYPRKLWSTNKQVGLAISGGVDSMALATLYSKAVQANESLPKYHAIIIDHKVRPESTDEAHWVAEQLRLRFEVDSSIIPLTWPENCDPQRFETDARRLRYQALGLACRERGINLLFVAHHGDDQAETVIMRLIKGRWRAGLQGMQGVEWIPDCYGIHGVHHSGGIQNPELGRRAVSNLPFPIEQGGIQVLRPLLGFDKSRLIKTCEENGIAWAEDATNHMPMTTTRNAVRHMIGNHKLPEALSNQSLVQLAQHVQERVRSHKDTANKVFDDCLMKFDMQTASLIARFPASDDFLGGRPIVTESDKIEARNTAYVFLQRLTGIISPMEVTSVGQLSNAIDYIYPALRLDDEGPDHAHTVCGVWFRPYDLPSPFESDDGIPTVNVMEYMLSRQPLDVTSKTAVSITIPPATLSSLSTHSTVSPPNDFHLFDGRFWIRVVNKTVNRNITLRTLTHADIAHINEQTKIPFFHSPLSSIKAALVLIRPGITRLTIPALFLEPDPESADSKDASPTLLALPTFNASVEDPETRIEEICEWEVRYKKVDFGSRAEDIVMPPRHLARQVKRERERMERTMYSMPMVDRKEIKKRRKLV